jgi:cytochrome c6
MSIMKRSAKKITIIAMALVALALIAHSHPDTWAIDSKASDGAALFKSKCATCHAADGSGNTTAGKSLKVRDLRSTEVQGKSDDQLYAVIAKGKGKMPAYEKSLGEEKIRQLIAFIRSLRK